MTVNGCTVRSPLTGCQVTSRPCDRFSRYSKWLDTFRTALICHAVFMTAFQHGQDGRVGKLSSKLHDIHQCRIYSGKLLMMDRGTAETCRVSWQNKVGKLVRLLVLLKKKFVTMHGNMNVKNAQLFHKLSHSYTFRHYLVIHRKLVINALSSYIRISNTAVGNTILIINCITNSCFWHTCVTWQGIDYKLSENDMIVSKHVGVWYFVK